MAAMRTAGIVLLLLAAPLAFADMPGCGCDPADAKSMEARECGLSREALAQASGKPVVFVKDINPRKPNRWVAMPSAVRKGESTLSDMSPQARLALWTDAIQKAKELWGGSWALAYNGDEVRTQCQPHLHIGKLIEGVETPRFVEVDGPAQIPVPANGEGLWVHPQGKKLHVHLGEQLTESVLLR
jgi:hypothetical protein